MAHPINTFIVCSAFLLTSCFARHESIESCPKGSTAANRAGNFPLGFVKYRIQSNIPEIDKKYLIEAMHFVEKQTSLVFEPAETQSTGGTITLQASPSGYGDWASGSTIQLSIGAGAFLHELGHVFGLQHEHQRPDRDKWIIVDPKDANNPTFVKMPYVKTHGHYDYASVMNYGWVKPNPDCRLENGQPCFTTTPKIGAGGSGGGYSAGDVATIKTLFSEEFKKRAEQKPDFRMPARANHSCTWVIERSENPVSRIKLPAEKKTPLGRMGPTDCIMTAKFNADWSVIYTCKEKCGASEKVLAVSTFDADFDDYYPNLKNAKPNPKSMVPDSNSANDDQDTTNEDSDKAAIDNSGQPSSPVGDVGPESEEDENLSEDGASPMVNRRCGS